MFSVLSNELLLAIPFFTFMGVILQRCGLAEDLLDGFGQLFGGVLRRPFLCGHPCRRHPWRNHRHGGWPLVIAMGLISLARHG